MFMNELKGTLNEEFNTSVTENGAVGYRTTGKELLDINFAVSSMRNMPKEEIVDNFIKVFYEDKLLAVKWLFFARDVRHGMGERRLFRYCLDYLANYHPDIVRSVISLVPEYGRWDDLWCLLDTPIAEDVIDIISKQLVSDISSKIEGKSISLIAKWLPSINTSSKETRRTSRIIIKKLKMNEKTYKKLLSELRAYLKITEIYMSQQRWDEIEYSAVPSRANLRYNNAFLKHDEKRRRAYLESLRKGETKINAGVLFPHDIVHQYMDWNRIKPNDNTTLEELWKALPDYVNGAGNTICVADGSGSMTVTVGNTSTKALDVANALAIYFAERSSGEFKDTYVTFSERPQLVDLSKGHSLREKIEIALTHNEIANTNIEAVFDLILTAAVKKSMSQDDIPRNILILSDMEFDQCATTNNGNRRSIERPTNRLFEEMADRYATYGYKLPRLIFWNINSRTGTIPVKENDLGVALVSGFSPVIMKMVLNNETDPLKCLLEQLNSDRYSAIEDALKPPLL